MRGIAFRPIPTHELSTGVMGWWLNVANRVRVRFELPPESPFGHPSLFLEWPEPRHVRWRNVDLDGKMCLYPPGSARFPMLRPEAVMHVLDAMDSIIATNIFGDAPDDVIVNRQYWVNQFGGCWSLVEPGNAPCMGIAAQARGLWVLAENELQCQRWLSNTEDFLDSTVPLLAKWVDKFDDIPVSRLDIGSEEHGIFAQGGLVLYFLETDSGPLGFAIAASGKDDLTRFRVERADRSWLHERGSTGLDPRVKAANVAIVGCGSLGAGVAELLIRSGVGSITLIDNDDLTWGNVARHALGGQDVGRLKVEVLAERLRRHIPTINSVDAFAKTWQSVALENPAALDCDLIVSTIATWPDELALARWAQERQIPLIMGWIEGSAIAGHALALQEGCLCDLFDPSGNFLRAAAEWTGEAPLKYAQACHENYYPYGYADIVPIQSMIAALALGILCGDVKGNIHRCQLPEIATLNAAGATPTADYLRWHNQGFLPCRWQELQREWPEPSGCWSCP